MTGNLGYDDIRAATVRQVAQLMAAAAITAPKSGGQLFLAGKASFMETVIIDDPGTHRQLAVWMRARGKERRERIWFRDAEATEAVDAILFIGLLPGCTRPTMTAGPAATPLAPSFCTNPKPCAASRPTSNSPARSATCATSTSASPSAQPPKPPPSTPSTAAARPASPQEPASSGTSKPSTLSPWPVHDPQSHRVRPHDARSRFRLPRPPRHWHPARRRTRRQPPPRSPKPPGTFRPAP
jgi:hypothetical protein